ncbi:MAG TPA: HEPN domain-containing protein [archaeon]|nr:HEPN domain-containing protein [archaeon]
MIVSVEKWKGKGVYLVRAEQYLRAAENSFKNNDWDAAVGNAIHCIISAADAFCIDLKTQRYKGTDHREAAEFFARIISNNEHKKATQRLFDVIQIKTDAEYGDKNLGQKEASSAKMNAERFLGYVKACISTS